MTHRPATACLLAVALALAACTSGFVPSDPGEDVGIDEAPVVLRLLLFGGPEELEAYERVAAAWEQVQDESVVEVAVVAKQDDLLARLTASFAAGNPPDVFLVNFRKYGLYAEQGVLAEAQDFLDDAASDADEDGFTIDLDQFYAAPLDAFRFDGDRLTCVPQNASSLVTYVNTDLFTRAGVDLPLGGWDWEQFKTAAGQISESLDDDQYAIGTDPKLIRLAPMVWSNGGDVVDDPRTPSQLTLDTAPALEALEFFASLVPERLAPDDLAEQARDAEARFLAGDLAMYWSSRRDVPSFRAGITDFSWDVVPFPIAPGGTPVTMLHSDAFCLSRAGLTAAAWEFVEFALSADGGAPILAESGRTVPSNRAVAESAAFLRPDVPPANARVFLDNAELVRATPSTATWNEVEKQADDVLEELFYGRLTVEEALDRLADIAFR